MALENTRDKSLFYSYAESKSGNENSPETYVETTARIESQGKMTRPEPTRIFEDNTGKLGTGQLGTLGEIQAIGTPFTINGVQRLSEFAYLLSFLMGKSDNVNTIDTGVYSHMLDMLAISSLEVPTFTSEFGNESSNDVIAGCVINEGNITIPFSGSDVLLDASFSGWGNNHYVSSGVLTVMSSGSMSSAAEDLSSEPLINGKCCQAWIASALEDDFGQTSIDYTGEDLGTNLVEITEFINSINFKINNGMSLEGALRGGGCGIINDWTRNIPDITLEINLHKDEASANFRTFALGDTQKSLEILFQGPVISGAYRYAMDLFFPVIAFRTTTEDDSVPTNLTLTPKVFENSSGYPFRAFFQTAIDEGYNAQAP